MELHKETLMELNTNNDIYELLQDQFNYVKKLSISIQDSIIEYTGNSFEIINDYLRIKKRINLNERDLEVIDDLDKAFIDSPPIKNNITVYRGINTKNFIPEVLSFISTTHDINSAFNFTGKDCCLLRINVSSGSQILPIESISLFKKEKEILLPRTGKLIITNKTTNEYGLIIYDLTYIPPTAINIGCDIDIKKIDKKLIN